MWCGGWGWLLGKCWMYKGFWCGWGWLLGELRLLLLKNQWRAMLAGCCSFGAQLDMLLQRTTFLCVAFGYYPGSGFMWHIGYVNRLWFFEAWQGLKGGQVGGVERGGDGRIEETAAEQQTKRLQYRSEWTKIDEDRSADESCACLAPKRRRAPRRPRRCVPRQSGRGAWSSLHLPPRCL